MSTSSIQRWFLVIVLFGLLLMQPFLVRRAVHNCDLINDGRAQGNVRAHVLKQFMLDAATARSATAAHETGARKLIDLRAASRYNRLATQIINLPKSDCLSP